MTSNLIFPMIKPDAQVTFTDGVLFIRQGDVAGPYSELPLYAPAVFVSADCIKWYLTELSIHEIGTICSGYYHTTASHALSVLTSGCKSFEPDFN